MNMKKNLKKIAAISMLASLCTFEKSNADFLDWLERGVIYCVCADGIWQTLKGESLIKKGLKGLGYSNGLLNGKDKIPEETPPVEIK